MGRTKKKDSLFERSVTACLCPFWRGGTHSLPHMHTTNHTRKSERGWIWSRSTFSSDILVRRSPCGWLSLSLSISVRVETTLYFKLPLSVRKLFLLSLQELLSPSLLRLWRTFPLCLSVFCLPPVRPRVFQLFLVFFLVLFAAFDSDFLVSGFP